MLKYCVQEVGVWSVDHIPCGTRFGPVSGRISTQQSEIVGLPLKYRWQVHWARSSRRALTVVLVC